jgi:hypothetical protein
MTTSHFHATPFSQLFAKLFRTALVCASATALVACESTPMPVLDSTLIPEAQRKGYQASISKAKACPLHLDELTDIRASKDLLVGSSNVSEDALYGFLEQSLLNMNVAPTVESNNSVKVALEKAFVKMLGNNLMAIVVINVQYKPHYADEFSPEVSYRGQSVKVNANSDNDDYALVAKGAVKEAIHKATQRVKSSLLHQCDDPVDSIAGLN